ncbi:MAG: proline--tRNA ligase [Helicobacteraceae bacterium]|nr:proline--tRNA ligase [Helicobacteraceae bacterium]
MRFSKLFIPTTKEVPKDCVLKSHNYLLRGGFIKQIGSGIYSFLPLGKIVLEKVKKIIKEEMDKSGSNELALGFITPASLWVKSKRYNKYGKELLKFKDRKNNDFVLGPTHEEAILECVKGVVNSYKQLPLNLYQINLKFRDEIRPRFGLMRAREFIMKDAYSFHSSKEDLDREFNLMEQTYRNIFTRLGVDFRIVEADSGAIGGSGSKEFMILAQSGEDDIVICKNCDYASNIEIATRFPNTPPLPAPHAEFNKFYTPNIKSIKDLSEFFKVDSFYLLKCVAKKAIFDDGSSKICFFFVRGSDELSPTKALNAVTNANSLEDLSIDDLEKAGLKTGFIGPYGLKNIVDTEFIFFDNELLDSNNLICGANERDYHFIGVNLGSFENLNYKDLIEIKKGDLCPKCKGKLDITKGIEIGHIFKLGTRYSKELEATFLDENGKAKFFEMGCYGIGVSRILPAILEQKADNKGAIWGNMAPFSVVVIISNVKNNPEVEFANSLYESLKSHHIEVLLDDRDLRFGAKMADFELIGFKNAIIIGKEFKNNKFELVKREKLQKQVLDSNILVSELIKLL